MKSKPIGVRFDLNKLDMIQKEQNLTSVQQVVNYLMDNYGKPLKNIPTYGTGTLNLKDILPANDTVTAKNQITPPSNLTGIDLAIWKSENLK